MAIEAVLKLPQIRRIPNVTFEDIVEVGRGNGGGKKRTARFELNHSEDIIRAVKTDGSEVIKNVIILDYSL